ncbi:MAG: PIN domain-containing protein [Hyphomicrobiales bacterium]
MTPVALLDANVLYPIASCDLLLRLAEADVIRIAWSDRILDEVFLALERDWGREGRCSPPAMEQGFPDALVEAAGFEARVPEGVDAGDRHVVTAALSAGATVIVTNNASDFPAEALGPLGLGAQSLDEFLLSLLEDRPDAIAAALEAQASALKNPSRSVALVVGALGRSAPRFAERLAELGLLG